MNKITGQEFEGERPLYASRDLRLEDVVIHEGESALKESAGVEALRCRFEGRYPFWCCRGASIEDCFFTEDSRAPVWYSSDVRMKGCEVYAPKILRELDGVRLEGCLFPKAVETLWDCRGVDVRDCTFEGADYLFSRCRDVKISGLHLKGKYTFQYVRNVEIRNSVLDTKDAFWESDDVTVYDSVVRGEYLAWYSRNLRLVRCRIAGTQPLCYASGLVLEDCTFEPDADLAFEYSSVNATLLSPVTSVKNPLTGRIRALSFGEIILDENLRAPGDCVIETLLPHHVSQK